MVSYSHSSGTGTWQISQGFFTPEPHHEWHKKIWDHKVQLAINIVRAEELDPHISILQPSVGFQHFRERISYLTKVTGRMQWDVQRTLIAVITGAAPPGVVIAIHALLDFCYLAQAPEFDNSDCDALLSSLCIFHKHKLHMIKAGGWRGKKKKIINWYISKFKFSRMLCLLFGILAHHLSGLLTSLSMPISWWSRT